jgi:hypothetical protein
LGKEYWFMGRQGSGEKVLSTVLNFPLQMIQVQPKLRIRQLGIAGATSVSAWI